MTTMPNVDVTSKLSSGISQRLHDVSQDLERRMLDKCQQRGHDKIRRSHTTLFAHLGYGAQRLTTLAERAGITQQAMGKLVKELERLGYLTRHVDDVDKRAKIIEPTELGKQLVSDCLEIMDEIIEEYTNLLGSDGFSELEASLTKANQAIHNSNSNSSAITNSPTL